MPGAKIFKRNAMVQVFSHRRPALLITGQTVSNFGDGVANIALTLLVYRVAHGSALDIGIYGACRLVPLVVLLLFGGALVDRHSRRIALLTSDLVRAVTTGALVVLGLTNSTQLWELFVFSAVFGVFDSIFMPAITAITPEITPPELLPAMVALRPITGNLVGGILGPALGGILAAWSITFAIGLDSVTFVVSAIALVLLGTLPAPTREGGTSMLHEIREGLRFIRQRTWLWSTMITASFTNAFVLIPFFTFDVVLIRHTLGAGKVWVGIISAVGGVAGFIGGVVVGSRPPPVHRMRVMWGVWIVSTLAGALVGLVTSVWEVMIIPALMNPGIMYGNVIYETMLQQETPKELLGRISSADWFVSLGIAPAGVAAAGALIGAIGIRTYFVVAGLLFAAPLVAGLVWAPLHRIDAGRTRASVAEAMAPSG